MQNTTTKIKSVTVVVGTLLWQHLPSNHFGINNYFNVSKSEICDDNDIFVPEDVMNEAVGKVVPVKSKILCEKEYNCFCNWRNKKNARGVDEKIILAYISERSKTVKSSSLWSYHSQLKKMLLVKENVDINRFHKVKAFLKQHSVGHRAKKSKVFTREELERFLDTAPDDKFLLLKPHFLLTLALT
ncbi:uncharacterized protein LOC123008614 [Tribolium madens]|uniref:uncharacterized protein LOC123008614 n=1 Tax=Tribolium madens TaxID=41895 RepID=UPI001CF72568|nr:uncharacterized protein LOC123008614 [Tribolium madens]